MDGNSRDNSTDFSVFYRFLSDFCHVIKSTDEFEKFVSSYARIVGSCFFYFANAIFSFHVKNNKYLCKIFMCTIVFNFVNTKKTFQHQVKLLCCHSPCIKVEKIIISGCLILFLGNPGFQQTNVWMYPLTLFGKFAEESSDNTRERESYNKQANLEIREKRSLIDLNTPIMPNYIRSMPGEVTGLLARGWPAAP